ncbi:response regulator [Urbifossiella limnaea]|uniref:Phosphate regulon transcriptional regulatory protein PhoB n=1 Tax=Urbifossiella limnaea TaxID=2528023 RepID=A0A517XY91_9BACT|nr:response regulator [Urbifossiella limnaea]QDU22462.1 Phosphate regulon transcriptional regulatory protein PhoB [Urbifossiella limnaea]
MSARPTVLLAESDPAVYRTVSALLRRQGYAVEHARTAAEAEGRLREALPDLLVAEFLMPGGCGVRVAELAKALSDDRVPVVMLSALAAGAHLDFARAAGADEVLAKPFQASDLLAAVGRLCPVPRAVVQFAEAV